MGTLTGVRIVEVGGIGGSPFACMMLADMGADIVRIERPGESDEEPYVVYRNRRIVTLNLKQPEAVRHLLRLVSRADILVEAYRPGVMERLGIGPDVCLKRNPKLVYGRMTGWGQSGPLAQAPGHDINYIALSGLLHLIGEQGGKPVPPLNVIGDFGGALMFALGLVSALFRAQRDGEGQVIDAAMIDAAIAVLVMSYGPRRDQAFADAPGESLLAGAAPYYGTYETADGKFLAIAPMEPKFYACLIEKLGLDADSFGKAAYPALDARTREELWPPLKAQLTALFRTRTRDEWCALLEGTEACVTPVLSLEEAPTHPHNLARNAFASYGGVLQNAPAPRFSKTPAENPRPPAVTAVELEEVLEEWTVKAT